MATKKPEVKNAKPTAAKKPAKAVKKTATKKIVVKPAKPTAATAVKKAAKKGLTKPMTKVVVDRMPLPHGGKIFVKAAKRPTAKNTAKKAK